MQPLVHDIYAKQVTNIVIFQLLLQLIHRGHCSADMFSSAHKSLVCTFVCQSQKSALILKGRLCDCGFAQCLHMGAKAKVKEIVKVNHKLKKMCFSAPAVAAMVSICFAPPQSDSSCKSQG